MNDSDQEWLDRLSGKVSVAKDAHAVHEAELLRFAIEAERQASASEKLNSYQQDDEAQAARIGEERLLFALRRENLLPSGASLAPAVKANPKWMMPAALAATVFLGVLTFQALQTEGLAVFYDAPPVMRGQVQQVVLMDRRPRQKAEELAKGFKEAGLAARLYQAGEFFYVDVDLVAEKVENAAKLVEALGAKAKPGQLRVEVKKIGSLSK